MRYPYPVMRKGLCYFSTKKHYKKARYKKAFSREIERVKLIFLNACLSGTRKKED